MAHDAADVAKAFALRAPHRRSPVTLPRRRNEPQRPGPGATASSSTCASTSAACACEDDGRRARVQPRHGARPRQPRAAPPSPQARSRSRRRTDIATVGRRDRQQLRRHALRRHVGLLLDRARDDARAALRHGDRHRRARRRGALRARRARARRAACSTIRDELRGDAELRRARAAQVRDQEHDGLPAVRVPRCRHAARDLPPPRRRLRGHARLHRRGRVRDACPCRARTDDLVAALRRHRRRATEPVRELVAAGATRGRADGRAGADRRRQLDRRHAPSTGSSCRPSRPRCWWSSAAPTTRRSTRRSRARRRSSTATSCCARPTFTRDARGDRGRLAACARACSGWSAGCARRARR